MPVQRARSAQTLSRPRSSVSKGKGKNPATLPAAGAGRLVSSGQPLAGLTAFHSGRRFAGHDGQNPRSGTESTARRMPNAGADLWGKKFYGWDG